MTVIHRDATFITVVNRLGILEDNMTKVQTGIFVKGILLTAYGLGVGALAVFQYSTQYFWQ